jgi:class 3 adenylate cyclase
MLAASIYSYLQTMRVRDASADIYGALVPLSAQLTAIERNVLEQELILQRALRHGTTESADAKQTEIEIARFRTLDGEIQAQFNKSKELIGASIAATSIVEDAVQLAQLMPELEAFRRDHMAYSETGFALIAAMADYNRGFRALEEQLSRGEDTLHQTIDRLSARLDSAESSESGQVLGKEQRAYLVSMESLALAVLSFLAGTILSSLVSRRMVRPVRALISGAEEVSRGNLDVAIQVNSRDEVGKLSLAFQKMVGELRSKERIKETFGKYMDPRVVERLLADGQPDLAGGEKKVMTVFFSDLQGFTSISEFLTAAGLVNLINSYLTLASRPIVDNKGVIDKYIGDAIMAFWGPPFYAAPDHARRACLAALAQQQQLAELKLALPDILGFRRNLPEMHVRIGLCTGELIVGSIGSNVSKSFTVMGDTVNTASRLESANKQFGTWILIDGQTFDMVQGDMEARQVDLVGVIGKAEPVRVYELLGEKGKVEAPRLELRDAFEAGLNAYRACDWDLADRHFGLALGIDNHDKSAMLYRERIQLFRKTPPPPGWDGSWRLNEK